MIAPVAAPAGRRIIALGDSWFRHFPPFDAVIALQRKHGWAVQSLAVPGTPLQKLVPVTGQPGQLDQLVDLLHAMPADQRLELRAFLVSGGGNDVVDVPDDAQRKPWIARLLRPAADAPPAIDAAVFQALIGTQLREALADVLSALTEVSFAMLGRALPILIHGYDHPVPDGRGADKGPWLRPHFVDAGYATLEAGTEVMAALIDGLNDMQRDLLRSRPGEFAHVRHVDLRGALGNDLAGGAWRARWQNELHPTIPDGFVAVADRLHAALRELDNVQALPRSAARRA